MPSLLQLALTFVDGDSISRIEFTDLPDGYDRIWVRLAASQQDKIFGGGEQFSFFNMRGREYPIWTREQGP